MTDPINFSSVSPRHSLPMLFAGQSQKEVTVNEGLLLTDLLLHPLVEGTAATPPTAPNAGQCWIVAMGASGAFSGNEGKLAAWSEGGWRFVPPSPGMRVFDTSLGSHRLYSGSWGHCIAPAAPTGGTVVDVQARATIVTLITLLKDAGIFSAS